MNNKVNYEEFNRAKNEMLEELEKTTQVLFNGKRSNLVEITTEFSSGRTICTKVNWSGMGAVEVYDAMKFVQLLTKATALVNNFKYNGFKISYND